MWPFIRKKSKSEQVEPTPPNFSMPDFFDLARREIDGLIAQDPDWFRNLPYQGNMSQPEARMFEIEKRAVWHRVVYDAGRGDILGLVWTTRGDDLVCPQCRALEGCRFLKSDLAKLDRISMHVGCRCELVPIK